MEIEPRLGGFPRQFCFEFSYALVIAFIVCGWGLLTVRSFLNLHGTFQLSGERPCWRSGEEKRRKDVCCFSSFSYLSWVIRILFKDQLLSNQLTKPDAD